MWDETLIESMGKRNNGKRWVTVQVAAIVHAGVVAVLAAASFWYVDVMQPVQAQTIRGVFFAESVPTPAQIGVPKQTSEKPVLNNSKPVETITQEKIVPEGSDFVEPSKLFMDVSNFGNLPKGDLNGVDGGTPNGSENGGFGSGTNGIGSGEPIKSDDLIKLRVDQPVVIHKIDPIYPLPLLRMHKEGVVILEVLITASGDVQKIQILKSDHSLFAQSAINAVGQWKYRPAQLRGKPVAVYFRVTVVFTIK